ncbi:DinB family protein [Parasphingorhabdus pacifica]
MSSPLTSYDQSFPYAGTATLALRQLDEAYHNWSTGVLGLTVEELAAPCGPAEGPWADASMAELVLHINREVIHHGAEIALLRDLYRHRTG